VSDPLIARYARTAVLAQNGVCSPGLANGGSQFAGHRDEVTVADQSVVAASEHIAMGADSGPSPRREGATPRQPADVVGQPAAVTFWRVAARLGPNRANMTSSGLLRRRF
jgi:hypothetical protein